MHPAFERMGQLESPQARDYDAEALVEAMFAGKKAGLRPLYESLLDFILSLGGDVKACPCKTIVPFYRKHVFAELKPATQKRLDVGFCLRGQAAEGRLLDTGGQGRGDRITHRIGVTGPEDFDEEVRRWLRQAYLLGS